ncbi:MobP3 family relaxase [Sulfobacillus harzensis]|uniref:Uncharacterized protein n=1 Tax=Sulfobacillus harzensis TaxID=2729629 RepID=A0A7Y0L6X7_9FIRM|nr:MobP3 family relaxase [Sulfobacillus harzensis]NMP24355.1 hypothetical protein [Sulfobacillus harzensis]
MALRPFVIKTAFYLPGQQGFGKGMHGALAHLDYMGDPNRHKKPDEELLMGSAAIHAKYMTERPGVSGYFGPDPRELPDVKAVQATITDHQGPVWRAFISVTEDDAKTLGGALMTREGWEQAARAQLPKTFEQMGLDPANVDWIASVHKKEGHPHLHLLFWERDITREKGKWSDQERRAIRRGWIQELYGPERDRLGAEKSTIRQALVTTLKEKDPGWWTLKIQRDWQGRLNQLADVMPGEGRAALKFLPSETKEIALDHARWLIETVPAFHEQAARYRDIAAELAQHYSDNPDAHQQARQKAQDDLIQRVAQVVVKEAATVDRQRQWDAIRGLVDTDDRALRRDLVRLSRLPVESRAVFRDALARQLVGESASETAVRKQARALARAADWIARRDEASAKRTANAIGRALTQMVHRAERDARLTAYWLAEAQWRAKKAQADIARNTGQEIAQ